jgi:RNA polymerase sigma-70 factor (ECF subfamily)
MSYKAILSNQVLFDAFKKGDQRAFMEIYQTLKKVIYAFTIKIIGSAEDAEDLTVQAFVRVWERRESIESMAHLKNLLFIVSRNGSIDFLREKRRSQLELTPEIAEELDACRISKYKTDQFFADLVEEISAVIRRMPKLRAKVFRMRYLEERSVKEVAEMLNLSIPNVYWHTKEAVDQVRQALLKKTPSSPKVYLALVLLITTAAIRQILLRF